MWLLVHEIVLLIVAVARGTSQTNCAISDEVFDTQISDSVAIDNLKIHRFTWQEKVPMFLIHELVLSCSKLRKLQIEAIRVTITSENFTNSTTPQSTSVPPSPLLVVLIREGEAAKSWQMPMILEDV